MAHQRVSIKAVARKSRDADEKARTQANAPPKAPKGKAKPGQDSFVNMAMNYGIGSQGPLSSASYAYNPITRVRTLLEWMYRGSWLCGVVVDGFAEDMTREGIDLVGDIKPEDEAAIHEAMVTARDWPNLCDTIKWSRLYGGAIAVLMIDGQDYSQPLRIETIKENQYRGLMVLDRWWVTPSLEDMVQTPGPDIGLPKYYRTGLDAPALRGQKIHYSRVIRLEGIHLPYGQAMQENMWGESILERLYDRMVAFDSATTGAAQLVYKCYLRTIRVDGLREIASAGGDSYLGLLKYMDMIRRFQGQEGLTLLDKEDEFEEHAGASFTGLDDTLTQLSQQLAGATGMPLVRLFGQSPSGFSTGDTDIRLYYDTIKQKQNSHLKIGVTKVVRCQAQSLGIVLPKGFAVEFNPLWQLTEKDRAEVAKLNAETVDLALAGNLVTQQVAMKELKQQSRITGVFSNITDTDIAAADDEVTPPPDPIEMMAGMQGAEGGKPGGDLPAGPKLPAE